jgi:hypothetical protein
MLTRLFALVIASLFAAACTQTRVVYGSGFTFANYDRVIVSKPRGAKTSSALYGMDVEFANLMGSYNLKVIGDNEFRLLPEQAQKRTLRARLSLTSENKLNTLTVSFDVMSTDVTGASFTVQAEGNMMKQRGRAKLLEKLSKALTQSIARDQALVVGRSRD